MRISAVVLAAGLGKRMKSKRSKVLHPVCGKPMVEHIIDTLEQIGVARTVAVVGHGAEEVKAALGGRVLYALQERQLGTGHAVMQAAPLLSGEDGITLVLCGDTPLISAETIRALIEAHRGGGAAATLLTAVPDDPRGYGRVVRGADGGVERIVEDKDCSEAERAIREINTGTYAFDNRLLFGALERVDNNNTQGEYYLTDVIGILRSGGHRVGGIAVSDPLEAAGVNDRAALAEAEREMRRRINLRHMLNGVTLIDPLTTYIDAGVTIGADTVIYPGCHLRGLTRIGEDCVIGPNAEIRDSAVGDGVQIRHAVLEEAEVGDRATVGPYAYLRPGARIASGVKIGDFVEIKNASIGEDSKVPHLSYIGDARIGKRVNIGCGTITANFDGFRKHVTEIGDDAFIGCNSNLIAPVRIGEGAFVVAGSTITHDVGDQDLAIARARQSNKPGYARKLRNKIQNQNNRI